MGECMDLSYCELRAKEIVNVCDGKRLGRMIDIVFSAATGEVCGIVAPASKRVIFSKNQEVFIPWECIDKIGEDVILVILEPSAPYFGRDSGPYPYRPHPGPPPPPPPPPPHGYNGTVRGEYYRDKGGERRNDRYREPDSGRVRRDEYQDDYSGEQPLESKRTYYEDSGSGDRYRDPRRAARAQKPDCDQKCEKCMMFDCAHRWKA